MYSKFGQFIHGKWQQSQNNETYDVINPATEEVIGKASKAGEEDVNKALRIVGKRDSWCPRVAAGMAGDLKLV